MPDRRKNILLTGSPGTGKTTACRKILEYFSASGIRARGFITEEIRESGKRKGFRIVTLDGKTGILSHVDHRSRHTVGRYGVNLTDLEQVALPEILPRGEREELIVIDEIGTMELKSRAFQETLVRTLDSPARVLATIKLGGHPLIRKIKLRPDVHLIELTPANRDSIPEKLLEMLRHEIKKRTGS